MKKTLTGGVILVFLVALTIWPGRDTAMADIGLWLPLVAPGELDLLDDDALAGIDARSMVDYSIWESGGSNNWGVVRFAWDIRIETYAEIDSAKLGHYTRTQAEMGRMGGTTVVDVYDPDNMLAITHPDYRSRTTADNRDRSMRAGGTGMGYTGTSTFPTVSNFGLAAGPAWTQWDLNLVNIRLGNDYSGLYSGTPRPDDGRYYLMDGWHPTGSPRDSPFVMDGLVFRAEFRYYGTPEQRLQRIVVGSNKAWGDVHAEIKVLSAWMTTEAINTLNTPARVTRDNFINRANTVWSDTIILGPVDTVRLSPDLPHGGFVSLDLDGPNLGWNALGGKSEYGKNPGNVWPFYYPKSGEHPRRNWSEVYD